MAAPAEAAEAEPFSTLLSLESQYHAEGYNLGHSDGARAGRTEGRLFGLEKGFEKAVEMGKLNGRASIFKARLDTSEGSTSGGERTVKHVTKLCELTDLTTLPTENDEESVAIFDERLRDAKAKMRLVGRLMEGGESSAGGTAKGKKGEEMEDFVGVARPQAAAAKEF